MIDIQHRSFEETLARCAEIGGVDLIFTSPPYPTEKPGAKGREGAPTRDYGGDAPKHFLWPDYQRLGDYCFKALKPGGFCIVIVDGPVRTTRRHVGSERSLIAFDIACDWARRVGFRFVEHEVYSRLGPPGDYYPRRRSGFEPMHVFQRPGPNGWLRGYFDAWSTTEPAQTGGMRKKLCATRMWNGRIGTGKRELTHEIRKEARQLTTVITSTPAGPAMGQSTYDSEHPAPFTRHIAQVQVLAYCPPNGLVCDPFNGSGTTGIAAARHGRRFIGGDLGAREKDGRRWADIGRERAEEAAREFAAQVMPAAEAPSGAPVVRPAQLGLRRRNFDA